MLISHEDTKTRRREVDALGKDLNVMTAIIRVVVWSSMSCAIQSLSWQPVRGLKPAANLRRRYAMIMKCQKSCRRAS